MSKGIPQSDSGGVGSNALHLKCFYTNAQSTWNTQEELKAFVMSQRFHIAGIRETCWNESCDCSTLLDGFRFCRRDRQGRRGRWVALHVIEGLQCMELTAGSAVRASGLELRGKEIKQESTLDLLAGMMPPWMYGQTGK